MVSLPLHLISRRLSMDGNTVGLWTMRHVVVIGALCVAGAADGGAQQVVTAPTTSARAIQRVTLDAEQVLLSDVLHAIARQAGLVPAFNDGILPSERRVTVRVRGVSVDHAFKVALYGTGLVARIHSEGNVAIVRGTLASDGGITGRVVDAKNGQPLRGVTIGLDAAERVAQT